MKRSVFSVIVTVAIVLLMTSCGKLPQAQIDAAKAAVEAAKTAQADIYAPAEYKQVQDSLNAFIAEAEAQNSKFFKSFGEVTKKLESVIPMANNVTETAGVKKEEVRVKTEALIAEVTAMIEENKGLITKAPRGKEGAAALNQIKNEMTVIEASLAEAASVFANGEYMTAHNKVTAIKENASKINTELKEAIAKVTRR